MAIYHYHMQIIGRSGSGSATAACAYASGSVVAGAAYRSGENISCKHDGKIHDYTHKKGIVHTEIMLPENAPDNFYNRETLWNAVELKNKRHDAQLARECDMALPVELSLKEQVELVREYVKTNFTDKGICADFAIHDNGTGNPHTHIMFTMDKVSEKGIGTRLDEEKASQYFNQKKRLLGWREDWARVCNKHLEKKGITERIDHRSFVERGINKIPTIHMGKHAHQLEKKGLRTERGDINRNIAQRNMEIDKINAQIVKLESKKQQIERIQVSIRGAIKQSKEEQKNVSERESRIYRGASSEQTERRHEKERIGQAREDRQRLQGRQREVTGLEYTHEL